VLYETSGRYIHWAFLSYNSFVNKIECEYMLLVIIYMLNAYMLLVIIYVECIYVVGDYICWMHICCWWLYMLCAYMLLVKSFTCELLVYACI